MRLSPDPESLEDSASKRENEILGAHDDDDSSSDQPFPGSVSDSKCFYKHHLI